MKVDQREVRSILRRCESGALGTHSASMPGFPFVTLLPYVLDQEARPVFLISGLAEHTRNLQADSRASLMVAEASDRPLEQARLTLVGHVLPVEMDAAARARYVLYRPEAAEYLELGDFGFFRLDALKVRLIGGFARMGWDDVRPLSWAPSAEDVCAITAALIPMLPIGVSLLGVDAEGADVRIAGVRRRLELKDEHGDVAGWNDGLAALLERLRSDRPDDFVHRA